MSDSVNKLTVLLEANIEKLERGIKQSEQLIARLDKKAKKVGGKSGGLGNILTTAKKLAPALSAAFAAREIFMFGKEAVMLGAKLEGIKNAFQLIENTGKVSMGELKKATRGAVDEMTLMSLSVQANNFKVPLENLGSFFEFATIRAAQTGESVEYLTRSIVTGIGRKSPLILDNLGITLVRLKEAMGKVGRESATVADISAAVAKIAKQETESLKMLGLTSTTTAQRIDKMAASFANFQASLGEDVASSGGFLGITEFISGVQDAISVARLIDDMQEKLGMSNSDLGDIQRKYAKENISQLERQLKIADELQKKIRVNFDIAKLKVQVDYGDVSGMETVKELDAWKAKTDKEFEKTRLPIVGQNSEEGKAIEAVYKTQMDKINGVSVAETKLSEQRKEFLKKYLTDLKNIQAEYDLGMIDSVQKATKENNILSKALVQMKVDVDGLGWAAQKEFGEFNKLLAENGVLIEANAQRMRDMISLFKEMDTEEAFGGLSVEAANLEGLDEKELSDLRDRINAFMESNDLGTGDMFGSLLEDIENIEKKLLDISIAEIELPINEFQELKKELLDIDRLSKENVLTEAAANEARLAALNKYIERLIEAGEIVPEIITKMRDSVAPPPDDDETKKDKEIKHLGEVSQMYSSISSALGQIGAQFDPSSGIAKFIKLAQAITLAASAAAALDVLIKGGASVPLAIAAAAGLAAALAGVAGSIGNVSGGFGGNGGGSGYNAALSGGNQLYTDIRGRDLRILLDREGKFSDRRGG